MTRFDTRLTDQSLRISASALGAEPLLADISAIRRVVTPLGGVEIPNASVTLDNASGRFTGLLRATETLWCSEVSVQHCGATQIRGVISGAASGRDGALTLDVEHALARPLSEPLRLRQVSEWPQFAASEEGKAIPVAYGRVRLTPIIFSADRRRLVLTANPVTVQRVERGQSDDEQLVQETAWQTRYADDGTGQRVQFLELARALGESETLAVTVQGRSGEVAAVLHDILQNHVTPQGVDAPTGVWDELLDDLRRHLPGVTFAGLLDDPTLRGIDVLDELIARNLGAVWSPLGVSWARVYPLTARPASAPLMRRYNHAIAQDARSSRAERYGRLRIRYAYDAASQDYRRVRCYRAGDGLADKYPQVYELEARWLHRDADAAALARRLLSYLARPRWRGTLHDDMDSATLPPMQWVEIDNRCAVLHGEAFVLGVIVDHGLGETNVVVEQLAGAPPPIELEYDNLGITTAAAIETISSAPSGAQQRFQICDRITNTPIRNAKVVIDGRITVYTDQEGRFTLTDALSLTEPHTLVATAPGKLPLRFTWQPSQ